MEFITSIQNAKVKNYNKLKKKRVRDQQNRAIIEGFHLIEEAVKGQIKIEQLFMIEPDRVAPLLKENAQECYHINQKVAETLSGTVTPQGVFAVIEKPHVQVDNARRVLILDRIQDPGNVGTIIRTADAAGLDLIVLTKGTADVYQEKVLRASQGSVFHIPIKFVEDIHHYIDQFEGPVFGSALSQAVSYQTVRPQQETFALIVGNEGEGVDTSLLEKTTQNLMIPIQGQAESLNVAIATGILMFHLRG
ncbi:RNA methyltransferase [Staphylococcus felis]|uniref:RNA methyltransferase n=1 Tax=Staphylococcus felis TaxID=46127 RepID=A0A3E0IP26_9STAP|nr:RNA methyltransferase [Staphylococcus felis]REH77394.1 RNA methyltransferase [Staphylococcus felis]REH79951.1 RNA methyltransferase [Staphylococcus felis]REH80154.1 RNA methyltransferase [Staphylococcus felis]REH81463.1 RNA methyltransferase [Staphylococcus felis]REH84149.1 RNA methyltransferase [Staphylococcus felis]